MYLPDQQQTEGIAKIAQIFREETLQAVTGQLIVMPKLQQLSKNNCTSKWTTKEQQSKNKKKFKRYLLHKPHSLLCWFFITVLSVCEFSEGVYK